MAARWSLKTTTSWALPKPHLSARSATSQQNSGLRAFAYTLFRLARLRRALHQVSPNSMHCSIRQKPRRLHAALSALTMLGSQQLFLRMTQRVSLPARHFMSTAATTLSIRSMRVMYLRKGLSIHLPLSQGRRAGSIAASVSYSDKNRRGSLVKCGRENGRRDEFRSLSVADDLCGGLSCHPRGQRNRASAWRTRHRSRRRRRFDVGRRDPRAAGTDDRLYLRHGLVALRTPA